MQKELAKNKNLFIGQTIQKGQIDENMKVKHLCQTSPIYYDGQKMVKIHKIKRSKSQLKIQ